MFFPQMLRSRSFLLSKLQCFFCSFIIILFTLLTQKTGYNQSVYVPLNHWVYDYIDRLETKQVIRHLLNCSKPLSRKAIATYLIQIHNKIDNGYRLNEVEQEQLAYLDIEFQEELNKLKIDTVSHTTRLTKLRHSRIIKKILPSYIYQNGRNFLSWHHEQFQVYFDPILAHQRNFRNSDSLSVTEKINKTTNGGRLWGNLGNYLGFFVDARDTKESGTRSYRIGNYTLPQLGFVRATSSDFIYHDETDAYIKTGYKHIDITFGKLKNYWGAGYSGSLILSDYATSYDQLKLEIIFEQFKFTSIYGYLIDYEFHETDQLQQRKYFAGHRLELMPWDWISLGLSETVIFKGRGFEPSYLNPVMFYRSAEHYLGSPDNVMMGIDLKCFPVKNIKTYGELLLDDITTSKLGSGWYGNKIGVLAGIFFADAFTCDNLDLRLEYVRLRPYIYSHENSLNHTHYQSTLGYWSPPNSDNWHINAIYRHSKFLRFMLFSEFWRHGANVKDENFGGNIERYFDHDNEYINFLDGQLEKRNSFGLDIDYEFFRNCIFNIGYVYSKGLGIRDHHFLFSIGINE